MRAPKTGVLAWVLFLMALAWSAVVTVAVADIYLFHTLPFGFLEWVVNIQVRNTVYWPGRGHHSNAYYVGRFFVLTGLLEGLGVWSYLYLRGQSKSDLRASFWRTKGPR